jgi:hypothetical protein
LSAQGKLSSTDTKSTDAWRFRFEDQFVDWFPTSSAPYPVQSFVINLSAKEESDRDFHIVRVGGEVWATLTDTALFLGGGPSRGPLTSWILPQRRPYIGADVGGYTSDNTLHPDANANAWLFGRLTARLTFAKLATTLGFHDLYLYGDDYLRYLPKTSHVFNYLKAGINCEFTKDVGIGFEYSYGNDSPKFLDEEQLSVALTLKF